MSLSSCPDSTLLSSLSCGGRHWGRAAMLAVGRRRPLRELPVLEGSHSNPHLQRLQAAWNLVLKNVGRSLIWLGYWRPGPWRSNELCLCTSVSLSSHGKLWAEWVLRTLSHQCSQVLPFQQHLPFRDNLGALKKWETCLSNKFRKRKAGVRR